METPKGEPPWLDLQRRFRRRTETAGLDEWGESAVRWKITRAKTNRKAAAQHLIDAYRAAGVALPTKDHKRAA